MKDIEKIINIISEQLGIDADTINEYTQIADLGADSLDIVEAIMTIEEEFDIDIDDEELKNIKTVGDFLDYLG